MMCAFAEIFERELLKETPEEIAVYNGTEDWFNTCLHFTGDRKLQLMKPESNQLEIMAQLNIAGIQKVGVKALSFCQSTHSTDGICGWSNAGQI